MAQFTVNADPPGPLQELQVPREVGRPVRRWRQQGQRAQADDRGGQAPRRRRRELEPQVARPHRVRRRSRSSAASPTTSSSSAGPTRSGTTATPRRRPEKRDKEVSLADFRKDIIIDVFNEAGQKVISYLVYRCWVSEYQALLRPRRATRTRWPSSTSSWRTRAGIRDARREGAEGADLHRPGRLGRDRPPSTSELLDAWERGLRAAAVRALPGAAGAPGRAGRRRRDRRACRSASATPGCSSCASGRSGRR